MASRSKTARAKGRFLALARKVGTPSTGLLAAGYGFRGRSSTAARRVAEHLVGGLRGGPPKTAVDRVDRLAVKLTRLVTADREEAQGSPQARDA